MKRIPLRWANGQRISESDYVKILKLRQAGCNCDLPLLGMRGKSKFRCRLCNTNAFLEVRKDD